MMAVLGIGLLALLVDFVFLRDEAAPQPARAQAAEAAEAGDSAKEGKAAAVGYNPDAPRYAMARLLRQYAAQHPVTPETMPDALQPPPAWLAELTARPVESSPEKTAGQLFQDKHRLSSVVYSHSQATAIVDGRVLRVGDRLDDFQLVSIGPASAVFANKGVNVVLTVVAEGPSR